MADYFTNFSLTLELPDEDAVQYTMDLAEQAATVRFEDDEAISKLPPDFPESLEEVLEFWTFETESHVETDTHQQAHHGIWLHSSYGGIDAVCAFIQHLLQKFNPTGIVGFEWAEDCSKPRIDAYGGGAAIVTATEIKTMNNREWLQDNLPAAGVPETRKEEVG